MAGLEPVQQFINSKDFIIRNNEEDMHKDWESQFVNKITPNETTKLLEAFNNGKILNKNIHCGFITPCLTTLQEQKAEGQFATTCKTAHRTGTSFTNKEGMTGAVNDFGIIEISGKKKFYIAVFIHDTYENSVMRKLLLLISPKRPMNITTKINDDHNKITLHRCNFYPCYLLTRQLREKTFMPIKLTALSKLPARYSSMALFWSLKKEIYNI